MKSNGTETRPNGNVIERITNADTGHTMYYVKIRKNDNFTDSKNGPWDYLYNARQDADREGLNK